jgi:hypothetical protein
MQGEEKAPKMTVASALKTQMNTTSEGKTSKVAALCGAALGNET